MKIIDFHAHILPGADHGSDCIETSLAQIELAKAASVDIIVATPHFYPHMHKLATFLERRKNAYEAICENTGIEILCGAEVLLCEKIENFVDIDLLCIEKTKTILLELPFSPFRNSYVNSVEALMDSGYKVVLAHAERYPADSIEALLSVGAKIQLNASAVSGIFVKKHIKRWIDADDVVALGSDIHMLNKKHYSNFKKSKQKLKSEFFDIMKRTRQYLNI